MSDVSQWQHSRRGYLVVLFVVIVAFVGVAAAMQVLVLTSVATTSRAYDSFRQGSIELSRLQVAVGETVLSAREISTRAVTGTLADSLSRNLRDLGAAPDVSPVVIPDQLPAIVTFPDVSNRPDALQAVPPDFAPFLTPELSQLLGPRVATYPESSFVFATSRTVAEVTRSYQARVDVRLVAVPLTRFGIAAYELPADIAVAAPAASPATNMPAGLVPARDSAFVADLQSQVGVLPYYYRRRASLAAAYQYLFSQAYLDRTAEYAGVAHFCDLAATNGTAVLAGLSKRAWLARWDLGGAGNGTFGTITTLSDTAVVFTESSGFSLHLGDSAADPTATPLCLVVLGPANAAGGSLAVSFGAISRPLIFIGYNVSVTIEAGVAINAALFLDPASRLVAMGPSTVDHISYWAGSSGVDTRYIAATENLPAAAEAMAPRVVYVATTAVRL